MDQLISEHLTLLISLPFIIFAALLAGAWKVTIVIAREMREQFRERLLLMKEVASLRDDVRDARLALSQHISDEATSKLSHQLEDLRSKIKRPTSRRSKRKMA